MSLRLKPYPEYRNSGITWLGEIPLHWEVSRLKTLVQHDNAQISAGAQHDLYIALEHVESWTGRVRSRTQRAPFGSQVKPFLPGDVLFGKLRPYLAKVTSLPMAGVCVGEFLVLRPRLTNLASSFLEYLLRSPQVISVISASTFGAKMPRADWNIVGTLRLALPPRNEQDAIVRFLRYADSAISRFIRAKRRLIEMLNEQKQAIIQRAVTRGLDPNVPLKPSGIDWLGDIPEHWKVRRLKTLAQIITSGSRGWARYYSDIGPIFLRIGNISTSDVDLKLGRITRVSPPIDAEGERTRVQENDVLLSITAQMGAVGICPPGLGEAYVNQHTALIHLQPTECNPRWVAYCLLSEFGKRQCQLLTNGGTKVGLTLDDVRTLRILMPPDSEQAGIVLRTEAQTRDLNAAITRIEREIGLLREHRARLIADVVTGKLDVRGVEVPMLEEAEELSPVGDEMPDAAMEQEEELEPVEERADAAE